MIHFYFKIKFLNFINVFAFIHDFPIKVPSRYPIYLLNKGNIKKAIKNTQNIKFKIQLKYHG